MKSLEEVFVEKNYHWLPRQETSSRLKDLIFQSHEKYIESQSGSKKIGAVFIEETSDTQLFGELLDFFWESKKSEKAYILLVTSKLKSVSEKFVGKIKWLVKELSKEFTFAVSVRTISNIPDFYEKFFLELQSGQIEKRALLDSTVSIFIKEHNLEKLYSGSGFLPGSRSRKSLARFIGPMNHMWGKNPFSCPPTDAKSRPAGACGVWFLGFSKGLWDTSIYPKNKSCIKCSRILSKTYLSIWQKFTENRKSITKPNETHNQQPYYEHHTALKSTTSNSRVACVLLFGAPTISLSNASLIFLLKKISVIQSLKPVVAVEDVTPAYFYSKYSIESIHELYKEIGKIAGVSVLFTSEINRKKWTDTLDFWSENMTRDDLRKAVGGINPENRNRGGFTVYDTYHLICMNSLLNVVSPKLVICHSKNAAGLEPSINGSFLSSWITAHNFFDLGIRIKGESDFKKLLSSFKKGSLGDKKSYISALMDIVGIDL